MLIHMSGALTQYALILQICISIMSVSTLKDKNMDELKKVVGGCVHGNAIDDDYSNIIVNDFEIDSTMTTCTFARCMERILDNCKRRG